MPDLSALKDALERLVAERSSREDRDSIRAALMAGVVSFAKGDRAVALGGSADGTVIVTGDDNVLFNLNASTAAAVDSVLRRTFPSSTHQLPSDLSDFAGRQEQVDALLRLLRPPGGRAAITAIDGMPGLGKTALAVHVGHRLAEHYPDGQLLLNLAGTSETPLTPSQALAHIIHAFNRAAQLPGELSELVPIYLDLLRGKRVLIVLDNARDGDQVAPLVPPESCAMIVTSRRNIAIGRPLSRVDLGLMAPSEAVGLLRSILHQNPPSEADLARLAKLCGLLPLALRVAGTFLVNYRHWTVASYLTALADERQRLMRLAVEGSGDLNVAASLSLSVRELRREHPEWADRWHELSVFAGSFDLAGAAAVWQQPPGQALDTMTPILARSMVLYDPAGGRYRLHDLMRDLASGRAALAAAIDAPTDLAARLEDAAQRHAGHYCGVLATADDAFLRGGDSVLLALALFDRDRRNIEAGQSWAAARAGTDRRAAALCAAYPDAGVNVLSLRQLARERVRWLEAAVRAARQIGDRDRECTALGNLGFAYADLSETRRAIEYHEQCLTIAREIGDRSAECGALGNLGFAYRNLGEARRAIEYYEQNLTIAREIGDPRVEGKTLGNLGVAYADLSDTRRAIEYHEQSLTIAREIGDRLGESNALSNLGGDYAALGETRGAIKHHEQHLMIAREIGDRHGEGTALGNLGAAYADLGEARRAIEYHVQCLTIAREIDDRRGEGAALGNLGLAYAALGETRRAIEYYEQSLAIAREIGDRSSEGNGFGNLGAAYAALGETRRAIENYEKGLRIARQIGDRRREGNALGNLGNAYVALGETGRAIEHCEQALAIFIAIEHPNAGKLRKLIADLKNEGGSE